MKTAAVVAMLIAPVAMAQSTAFTYQGQLRQGGTPTNGTFDMRFRAYDALTGGSQPGPTVCVNNVVVTDGVFTTTIDLGAIWGATAARWLEVEVRQDTGLTCTNTTGYTVLTPRQPISAAPRASSAGTAFALSAPDGSPSNAVTVDNQGYVGINLPVPGAPLHVAAASNTLNPGEGVRIQGGTSGVDNVAYLSFLQTSGTRIGYVGDGGSGDNDVFLDSDFGSVVLNTSGGRVLSALADGSLRLGTSSGDYRRFIIGGGNSDGFLYGSFASLGDGIHMGYNTYADAAGVNQIIHPDGGTSRISTGYGTVSFATAPAFGGVPVNRLFIEPSGRVGIGTTVPAAPLDVRGDIRLGSTGQYQATASEERLRIVRGTIAANGSIVRGSGFTVAHPSSGSYTITFTPPFAAPPTVTASGDYGTDGGVTTMVNSSTTSSTATVYLIQQEGILSDGRSAPFQFIAIGPR